MGLRPGGPGHGGTQGGRFVSGRACTAATLPESGRYYGRPAVAGHAALSHTAGCSRLGAWQMARLRSACMCAQPVPATCGAPPDRQTARMQACQQQALLPFQLTNAAGVAQLVHVLAVQACAQVGGRGACGLMLSILPSCKSGRQHSLVKTGITHCTRQSVLPCRAQAGPY